MGRWPRRLARHRRPGHRRAHGPAGPRRRRGHQPGRRRGAPMRRQRHPRRHAPGGARPSGAAHGRLAAGAQRRDRPPAHPGSRQAPVGGAYRGRRLGALFRILRQSGRDPRRPLHSPGRQLSRLHHLRTLRRKRPDHPVELPPRDGLALGFRRACHRQRLRGQIAGAGPAHPRLPGPRRRRGRAAGRRRQSGLRHRRDRRRGSGGASGYQSAGLHRLGGDRRLGGGVCGAQHRPLRAGTRRQVGGHHPPRRRPAASAGFGALGHLLPCRAGLLGALPPDCPRRPP